MRTYIRFATGRHEFHGMAVGDLVRIHHPPPPGYANRAHGLLAVVIREIRVRHFTNLFVRSLDTTVARSYHPGFLRLVKCNAITYAAAAAIDESLGHPTN